MIRRFLPIIGLALIVSAAWGWLRANTDHDARIQRGDAWARNAAVLNAQPDFADITARLKASGLFPMSKKRIDALEQQSNGANSNGGGIAGGAAPVFPTIIVASVVDGVAKVHLRLADGTIISAASGDTLESGWRLKTVDLNRVIAVYDEEEQEFKVTNYKERESDDDPQDVQAQ